MAVVANKRISYFEQRNRYKEKEYIQVDLPEKNHVDFEAQYRTYLAEQSLLRYFGYGDSLECIPEIDSIQLAKCISRLKERERRILFARVFGELDFTEFGEKFGMEPKQAEMAYYYIIRKLRKGMGLGKMNFEMLLERAKAGDQEAREEIFRMYRPLLIKNSMDQNVFDEDLYQELSATLLNCIQKFRI